tara:strand:+ start:3370 stop:3510 length:141 start_codon:yes stop_codon:yes gene_type:complete
MQKHGAGKEVLCQMLKVGQEGLGNHKKGRTNNASVQGPHPPYDAHE